jgi:hypothetical protein
VIVVMLVVVIVVMARVTSANGAHLDHLHVSDPQFLPGYEAHVRAAAGANAGEVGHRHLAPACAALAASADLDDVENRALERRSAHADVETEPEGVRYDGGKAAHLEPHGRDPRVPHVFGDGLDEAFHQRELVHAMRRVDTRQARPVDGQLDIEPGTYA